jgi:hypothetical protein
LIRKRKRDSNSSHNLSQRLASSHLQDHSLNENSVQSDLIKSLDNIRAIDELCLIEDEPNVAPQ